MKAATMVLGLLALALMAGSVTADSPATSAQIANESSTASVNWVHVYDGLVRQDFEVTIRGKTSLTESLALILENASFDLRTVRMDVFERGLVNQPIRKCNSCLVDVQTVDGSNKTVTVKATTKDCDACGFTMQDRYVSDWVPASKIDLPTTSVKAASLGDLSIVAGDSKQYLISFSSIPIGKTGSGYGSTATSRINLGLDSFYDKTHSSWWNTSYVQRVPITAKNNDKWLTNWNGLNGSVVLTQYINFSETYRPDNCTIETVMVKDDNTTALTLRVWNETYSAGKCLGASISWADNVTYSTTNTFWLYYGRPGQATAPATMRYIQNGGFEDEAALNTGAAYWTNVSSLHPGGFMTPWSEQGSQGVIDSMAFTQTGSWIYNTTGLSNPRNTTFVSAAQGASLYAWSSNFTAAAGDYITLWYYSMDDSAGATMTACDGMGNCADLRRAGRPTTWAVSTFAISAGSNLVNLTNYNTDVAAGSRLYIDKICISNSTGYCRSYDSGNATQAIISVGAVDSSSLSFWTLESSAPSEILETTSGSYSIKIYDNSSLSNLYNVSLYVNGSLITTSAVRVGNNITYSGASALPLLPGEINTSSYLWFWNISANGVNYTAPSGSTTITRLRILQCAAPMANQTMVFRIFDEDTQAIPILSNISATFTVWVDSGYRNYSFQNNTGTQYAFCIFPGWASAYLNATFRYQNTTYTDRYYFLQNAPISNSTQTIDLYNQLSTAIISPIVTVLNQFQSPQPNVIVNALRYYPGIGQYVQVASVLTGSDGTSPINLKPNEQYRYIITSGGTIIVVLGPNTLSSTQTAINLYINNGNPSTFYGYYGKISAICTNTSISVVCSYSDPSILTSSVSMDVYAVRLFNQTDTICSPSTSGQSGVLTCDMTGWMGNQTYFVLSATLKTGETIDLKVSTISSKSPLLNLGTTGLLMAFFIIVTMSLVGLTRTDTGIAGVIVFGYIGFFCSSLLGLIRVDPVMVAGLGAAVGVVVYLVARD